MLQIFDFSGNGNLADSEFLKKREAKILEDMRRRHEELRRWLIAHGCKVREENKEVT